MFRYSNYINRRIHLANDLENEDWNTKFYNDINKAIGTQFLNKNIHSYFEDYRYYSIDKENTDLIASIIGAFNSRISALEKEVKILSGEAEVKKISKHNLINQEETDDEFIFTYKKEKK